VKRDREVQNYFLKPNFNGLMKPLKLYDIQTSKL